MKTAIELNDVCLEFGSGFTLDHLSFRVEEGEIFGFLGPSGAGKTTTIKLLTRQLTPKSGKIGILGRDISRVGRDEYERIGILSDTSGLYERMSIEDNLNFFAAIRNVARAEVKDTLRRVRLYEERKTVIKKCSKGMRQRAVLASCILHRPSLLFLDEPTAGLDPATILEIHNMLLEMNRQGTTIFLTTHNMEEADRLCGEIGILDRGKLVASGSPEELKLRYARDEIRVLTTEGQVMGFSKKPQSAREIGDLIAAGRCLTIHSQEPNLEEIFLQLTGREF